MLAYTTLWYIINRNKYFRLPPVFWHSYFTRLCSNVFKVCCKFTAEFVSEKNWKSVNIWECHGQEFSVLFFLTHGVDCSVTPELRFALRQLHWGAANPPMRHIPRDQPNSRRKMRDFTGCFWKYVQFHGKFTEGVSEIHGKFTDPRDVISRCYHGFHGNKRIQGRRPISQKMSRPWNRELGWFALAN